MTAIDAGTVPAVVGVNHVSTRPEPSGHDRSRGGRRVGGRQCGRGCHAPADEPPAQLFSSPRQAALDGSDRAPQVTSGLLVRAALEIAKNHGNPVAARETINFLMDDAWRGCRDRGGRAERICSGRSAAAARSCEWRRSGRRSVVTRGPIGRLVQPGGRASRVPTMRRPFEPEPGTSPEMRHGPRGRLAGRPGRRGGQTGRDARPARRKPARGPHRARWRTVRATGRR